MRSFTNQWVCCRKLKKTGASILKVIRIQNGPPRLVKGSRKIEQERKKTSETSEEIFKRFLSEYDSGNEDGLWTTVSSYQNRTGNVVIEQLIDSYLEAAIQNKKEDASRALQQLSYLGDLQIRKDEDRFFFDLARFYQSSTSEQRDLVVKARELMKKGHADYGQYRRRQKPKSL